MARTSIVTGLISLTE